MDNVRISKKTRRKKQYWLLIPAGVFVIVMVLFVLGVTSVSSTADEKEMETIENAVAQSSVFCYGVEGAYPESIDYLKENYGLNYNEDKYIVEYEIFARNVRPQIRVMRKK